MHVFVETFAGLENFNFHCSDNIKHEVLQRIPESLRQKVSIRQKGGSSLCLDQNKDKEFIDVRLAWPICGGKGGFGSQLRAQGDRMNKKKKGPKGEKDDDSLRAVDGTRVKTIREAKDLAKYMVDKPEAERKKDEKKKAKLKQILEADAESKIKFDDMDYLEQSEELVLDVRNAVSEAGTTSGAASSSSSSSGSSSDSGSKSKSKALDFFEDYDDSDSD